MVKPLISPSILSADLLQLGNELKDAEKAGADWHHIDVMDGHFVPNLTFGLPLIEKIKHLSSIPVDVHIMVSNPDIVAEDYLKAGADVLSFHIEAANHPHRICQKIRESGKKAGLAVNPGTPIESVFALLDLADVIMIMSVNPGFGGQKFIPYSIEKIKTLVSELDRRQLRDKVQIEVDGGVNLSTIRPLYDAGASVFVAGTAVYGDPDKRKAVSSLKKACQE